MSEPVSTEHHIIDGYTLFKKERDDSGWGWEREEIDFNDPSVTPAAVMKMLVEVNKRIDNLILRLREASRG